MGLDELVYLVKKGGGDASSFQVCEKLSVAASSESADLKAVSISTVAVWDVYLRLNLRFIARLMRARSLRLRLRYSAMPWVRLLVVVEVKLFGSFGGSTTTLGTLPTSSVEVGGRNLVEVALRSSLRTLTWEVFEAGAGGRHRRSSPLTVVAISTVRVRRCIPAAEARHVWVVRLGCDLTIVELVVVRSRHLGHPVTHRPTLDAMRFGTGAKGCGGATVLREVRKWWEMR
jgi:hypothetical protein